MTIYALLITIAAIALLGYVLNLHNQLSKLETVVSKARKNRDLWRDYAHELEAKLYRLERNNNQLSADLTDYRINAGDLRAHKLSDNGHKLYAMELPSVPKVPNKAAVTMDNSGDLIVTMPELALSQIMQNELTRLARFEGRQSDDPIYADKRSAIAEQIKAESIAKNKETKPENKPNDNAAKSSNGDQGAFEATNTPDDKTLLTGDKFGELLDLLTANLKIKAGGRLPSAKYEYVKTMFLTWERGKKPNTAKEYATRIINNKFGGK